MRSKYWCFTINNYSQAEEDEIKNLNNLEEVLYIVVGKEIGESGTRHLQGYLELSKRLRLTNVKHLGGMQRAHLELRRGSAQQASDYCVKDGDILVQAGTISSPGRPGARMDLEDLRAVMLPVGLFF
jgi:hypothetical protein